MRRGDELSDYAQTLRFRIVHHADLANATLHFDKSQ
jgi:hypothetical protein